MESTLTVPEAFDRRTAALMHVATIFFPLVAPVVAMAIGRNRPFLMAHAQRSLKETLVLQVIVFVGGAISLFYSISSLVWHYQDGWRHFSIWPIVAKFVVVWIILGLIELVNTIQAVRCAQRAWNGVWPKGARVA